MSKIFYDHLIVFEEIEAVIKGSAETHEEREELWRLIDEIIHHRVLASIFDVLPRDYHEEFLTNFHQAPHDERHIAYLNEKIQGNIEEFIKKEIASLKREILQEIRGKRKTKG